MKINVAAALSFGIVFSCGCAPHTLAASAPTHIQNLQGCFRVSYRFVEDGRHDLDIKDALEWITLKRQSGAYLIQHYGIIRTGEECNTSLKLDHCSRMGAGGRRWALRSIHAFQRSGWDSCIAPPPAPQNPLATKGRPTTCSTASPRFKLR